ncbi:MAG TPA: TetR/AcrR family transcriptional regulator [Xanthobacteraceae bacterium]|jgi:AcrR family transcriptional regulator
MNPRVRTKPDDTREQIMATAEALFRRLGFTKTTVADIAAELRMSPANIYRFFPSKNAIVEAICRRCLGEVEEKAWTVARSKTTAAQRLERLILEILAYHKENSVTEHRVNELVVAAIEQSWNTIRAHKDVMRNVVELILRDGIEAGEFERVDPRATAELIMRSTVPFTNPLVVGQSLEEGDDLEAQARASMRFLLRAITPRR